MVRSYELQKFLEATRNAFAASGATLEALAVADKIFEAADTVPGEASFPDAVQMPACEYLQDALDGALGEGGPVAALAAAIGAIAPQLMWVLRPNGENDDVTFKARHANAVVANREGLGCFINIDANFIALAANIKSTVFDSCKPSLINGIRRVRNKFSKENFAVGIKRVNH